MLAMTKTRVQVWPNGMGADVRIGRLRFEIWGHGGVTKVEIDGSVCGFSGTHWTKLTPPATDRKLTADEFAALGEQAAESWRNRRNEWHECD